MMTAEVNSEAGKKSGDGMMILKKKEIIAASLVVLIGMAGYLNWSYQDTVRVRDNESYVQTGKTLGEAEMVSSNNNVDETSGEAEGAETSAPEAAAEETSQTENQTEAEQTASDQSAQTGTDGEGTETMYFEEAKMNREAARSAAMETLKAASSDSAMDEATRALAGEKLVACAAAMELENQIESIAAAKGFADVCAYINEGTATLTVRSDGLQPEDAAKLTDIVTSSSEIKASDVKIIEVK